MLLYAYVGDLWQGFGSLCRMFEGCCHCLLPIACGHHAYAPVYTEVVADSEAFSGRDATARGPARQPPKTICCSAPLVVAVDVVDLLFDSCRYSGPFNIDL